MSSKKTISHQIIKEWVEDRDGVPASVAGTERGKEEAGLLRIHFPEYSDADENLEEIDWENFFEKFDEARLAFLYDDKQESRFCKLVSRD